MREPSSVLGRTLHTLTRAASKRVIPILWFSILLFCGLGALNHAYATETRQPVELTQVDLFGDSHWKQMPVAINGFALGMPKAEAVQLALKQRLALVQQRRRQQDVCCTIAEVYEAVGKYHRHGNPIGLRLYFDGTNRISKMSLNVAEAMDPDVAAVNITHKFRGLTSQLFAHYSESLRQQIFGSAQGKQRPRSSVPDDTDVVIKYEYPQSGVTLSITTDRGKGPPNIWEVALDFYAPQ